MIIQKTREGRGSPSSSLSKAHHAYAIKNTIRPQIFYGQKSKIASSSSTDWVDGGLCPFHLDKRRGSFRVNLTSGAFKCFACNASGGDIIAFIMQVHGLSFREALLKLAQDWGVSLC